VDYCEAEQEAAVQRLDGPENVLPGIGAVQGVLLGAEDIL